MRNRQRYLKVLLGLLLSGGAAGARPGLLRQGDAGSSVHVMVAENVSCPLRGAVCFRPGSLDTVASLPEFASAGAPQDLPLPDVPTFKRMTHRGSHGAVSEDTAWVIDVATVTLHQVDEGDALFLFYDVDPREPSHEEMVAAYHAEVRGGGRLAARMSLFPDDGFKSGHTYRLRVTQPDGGEPVRLAQGEFAVR